MLKVSVIGLGYIGLPTAAFIANQKFDVQGIDVDHKIIRKINNNSISIEGEDKINKILTKTIKHGFLKASASIQASDVFIICVPTPVQTNKKPDFSILYNVVKQIAPKLKKSNLIVIESTIGPNVTRDVSIYLQQLRKDLILPHKLNPNIFIAHCPERIIPGNVYHEFLFNHRIIGGVTSRCAKYTKNFYKKFTKGALHLTDALTAELSKLTENSFRDVNIAFANELSQICNKYNINTKEFIKLCNQHPRVNILKPGIGVGGHCIPVDPYFLIDQNKNNTKLIQQSRFINEKIPLKIANDLRRKVKLISKNKKHKKNILIYFYGLTYKENVDDFRNSPALQILNHLSISRTVRIIAIDPFLSKNSIKQNNITFYKYKKPMNADLIIHAVNHQAFKKINFSKYKEKLISLI